MSFSHICRTRLCNVLFKLIDKKMEQQGLKKLSLAKWLHLTKSGYYNSVLEGAKVQGMGDFPLSYLN